LKSMPNRASDLLRYFNDPIEDFQCV